MKESDIQRVILDYLKVQRCFFWRNNVGGAKYGDRFVRFGEKGSPDIFVVDAGRIYGIEVKADKGQQNPNQKAWAENFQKYGGIYIIARSLEDVLKYF